MYILPFSVRSLLSRGPEVQPNYDQATLDRLNPTLSLIPVKMAQTEVSCQYSDNLPHNDFGRNNNDWIPSNTNSERKGKGEPARRCEYAPKMLTDGTIFL